MVEMDGGPNVARAASNPLTALADYWATSLTTFRRDGTPVSKLREVPA